MGFLIFFNSNWGKDEPQTLHYAIMINCPMGADVRQLAQNPKLLLVDEPVASMTDAATEETAQLLKSIAGDHAVIVVEHDMNFVRALDCKVTCLHEGAVLAEGSIDKASSDNRVIDVYLGR